VLDRIEACHEAILHAALVLATACDTAQSIGPVGAGARGAAARRRRIFHGAEIQANGGAAYDDRLEAFVGTACP
jgi:hypothetical protein